MTLPKPSDAEVNSFWTWFVDVHDSMAQDAQAPWLIREIDSRVEVFKGIGWEIGPDAASGGMAFVLSPGGDRDLLPITSWIVSRAPQVKGWTFYAAKPPKQWDLRFFIRTETGPSEVDARTWRYVLLGFEDDTFDIVIIAPALASMDKGYHRVAAEIVLDGLLGERLRLERIHGIDVECSPPDRALVDQAGDIRLLPDHLRSLI